MSENTMRTRLAGGDPGDTMYRAPEVAAMFRITKRTIYNEIKRGRLQAVKIGGQLRIRRRDIDAYLDSMVAVRSLPE